MSDFVGADVTAVVYLEDPQQTCSRERLYFGGQDSLIVTSGSTSSVVDFGGFPLAQARGGYLVLGCKDKSSIRGPISISMTFHTESGDVSLPVSVTEYNYRDVIPFSIEAIPLSSFSDDFLLDISVSNGTNQTIRVLYYVGGPLIAYNARNGLRSVDYGERMGYDENYPDFGLCRAHGSVSVKDIKGLFADIVNDPASHGIDYDVGRLDMRVEIFLGNVIVGTFEMDNCAYDNDGKGFTLTLKSPFSRLDNYVSGGYRVISRNQPLQSYVERFIGFSRDIAGIPLGMFDFASFANVNAWDDFVIGLPVLQEDVTIASFLDYIGQLTCSSILIRNSLRTSMKYGVYVVSWFPSVLPSALNVAVKGWEVPTIGPSKVMGSPSFNPLKGNRVDKITYRPYSVTISEDSEITESTVFPFFTVRPFENSVSKELLMYRRYWIDKSGDVLPTSNDSVYGCRAPRLSDLIYDSQSDTYGVHFSYLDNMAHRALTRGFLWRFVPVVDYSSVNSLSHVSNSYLTSIDRACYNARYVEGLNVTDNYYLMKAGSASLSGTSKAFSITLREKHGTEPEGYAHVSLNNVGVVKRTYYNLPAWFQPNLTHSLYANIGRGKYFDVSSSIRVKLYVSYYFSNVFGGAIGAYSVPEGSSDAEKTEAFRTAMKTVSPSSSNHPGPDNYFPVRTWEASHATKMSEYIRVEETAEQTYSYPHPWTKEAVTPVPNMLWSTFYGTNDMVPYAKLGASLWNGPAEDYTAYDSEDRIYRVGTTLGADGSLDLESKDNVHALSFSGKGLNVSKDVGVDGYRLFWEIKGPTDAEYLSLPWYHTGDDADARGGYLQISDSTLRYDDVNYDSSGMATVPISLPTDVDLKSIVASSDDNFIGDVSQEGESVGSYISSRVRAYGAFWNPAYAYSLVTRKLYFNPLLGNKSIVNLDDPNRPAITWLTGRPMYGYLIKDVKAVVTVSNCYDVSIEEERVVQNGKGNKYNYQMETNPLMATTKTSDGGDYVVDWSISNILGKFRDGRHILKVKTKAVSTDVLSHNYDVHVNRPPMVGDSIDREDLTAMAGGVASPIVPSVDKWFLRGIDVVWENGELYYDLELMESW